MFISEVSHKTEMYLRETPIADCAVIELPAHLDNRGIFVKNYHENQFLRLGLETQFPEEFYTKSSKGVLRGIHFTVPPIDQIKLVTCIHGTVIDAVIDLRKGSPTYGNHLLFELRADHPVAIYIGRGLGHGFYVPSDEAILLYRVSTLYAAEYDRGIHWASAGIDWPIKNPLVSDRDSKLPALSDFLSPFEYGAAHE